MSVPSFSGRVTLGTLMLILGLLFISIGIYPNVGILSYMPSITTVIQNLQGNIPSFSIGRSEISLLLGVILLFFSMNSKYRRFPPDRNQLFKFTYWRVKNNIYLIRNAIDHPHWFTFLIASLIFGIFLFYETTQNALVAVTAFYASVLFFRRALDIPIPDIEFDVGIKSPSRDIDVPPWDENDVNIVQSMSIENDGSAIANDVELKYRRYDLDGYPLSDWEISPKTINSWLTIEPGEREDNIPLVYGDMDEISYPFYVRIRASMSNLMGWIANEKIELVKEKDPDQEGIEE